MSFFEELRRRNVFRVGIAYVLIAWVLLQGADFALDLIDAPNWVIQALFLLAAIGMLGVLVFAWVFEVTPEGIKRETEIDRSQSITPHTGRKLDRVIIVFLALAVAALLTDRFLLSTSPPPTETAAAPGAEEPIAEKSIAVLPFINMSADADQEYFSDGITEEIINALVSVPGLKVAARTSVFALKGKHQDVRQTGHDLDVDHVLEGSVRSDGQQLRITAQLIQVNDGFHLWSETFNRERVNVFAIQEEIATSIAAVLSEQFAATDSDQAEIDISPNISIRAYEDYLRGRAHLRARTEDSLEKAMKMLRGVTESHPGYAPAWAALAITADVIDDHQTAEHAALRALEIEPDNADALNALGAVYRDTWRWAEAQAMFERAMAIDPESAELLEDYAEFMAGTGRVEEQLEIAARGYEVDPYLNPLVGVYTQGLISNGESGMAVEVLQGHLARGGAEWFNATILTALAGSGDDAAMHELISGLDLPAEGKSVLLGALENPGDSAAADKLLPLMQPDEVTLATIMLYEMAETLLLYLGHADIVLALNRERYSSDQWGSTEYWFMPLFADFRAHPKFADLLEMTRLPDYWDQAGWPEFCKKLQSGEIRCH